MQILGYLEAKSAKIKKEVTEVEEANKHLRHRLSEVEEQIKQLHEELASLKATVSAVVGRGMSTRKFFLLNQITRRDHHTGKSPSTLTQE